MGTALHLVLMCLLACELVILCFTLSRFQAEVGKHQEKLASELSEIKKLLEKSADKA